MGVNPLQQPRPGSMTFLWEPLFGVEDYHDAKCLHSIVNLIGGNHMVSNKAFIRNIFNLSELKLSQILSPFFLGPSITVNR